MRRWRSLLLLLAVLLLGAGGVAALAYAHRGYPDAVYVEQETLQLGSEEAPATIRVTRWIDPGRRTLLVETQAGRWLVAAGHTYSGGSPAGQPLTSTQARDLDRLCRSLQDGSLRGLGAAWLAGANGPVRRMRLAGQPALLVATTARDVLGVEAFIGASGMLQGLAWIDARTYAPLQRQFTYLGGGTVTERYVRIRRLAAYTLPADFFDPPSARQALWDRLSGWLHDHVPR